MPSSAKQRQHLPSTNRWKHFQGIPLYRLSRLILAVFFLFSIFGFFSDLMSGGRLSYLAVFVSACYSGITATFWIVAMARFPRYGLIVMGVLQIPLIFLGSELTEMVQRSSLSHPVSPDVGISFAAIGSVTVVMVSYAFFVIFIRGEGKESFRLRNELELAHGIQKTLVPPVHLKTAQFEIYGRSDPSDKVGGDLVDAVQLDDGSAVAYLADIAGHGLQAGILMGMLKTAARTALLDASAVTPNTVLPSLMERLNCVLPCVKEPQMYATFVGFRLNADGGVHYALAAHPPVLHYKASPDDQRADYLSAEQFPLGLLPVSQFSAEETTLHPGDLLIAVTDGILEASNTIDEEFGLERLQSAVASQANHSLPALADAILNAARVFGRQTDDQTLLLIRRL